MIGAAIGLYFLATTGVSGSRPRLIAVAIDGLAIYVHRDSPLKALTLQQVDSIFSLERWRGGPAIRTWDDLGLSDDWEKKRIRLYGHGPGASTYAHFTNSVLAGADPRLALKELPEAAAVFEQMEKDLCGIGFSNAGVSSEGVKPVAISHRAGPVVPTQETLSNFSYPMSRYLYIYIHKDPARGVDALTKEFLSYVLSRQGQQLTAKHGFFPITAAKAKEMFELIEVDVTLARR